MSSWLRSVLDRGNAVMSDNHPPPGDVTVLLKRIRSGEKGASDRLAGLVYAELRSLARARLRAERAEHTLSATALANEAWMRFGLESSRSIENRRHFFAIAATAMRRIL